jgi:hypothetical protein
MGMPRSLEALLALDEGDMNVLGLFVMRCDRRSVYCDPGNQKPARL